MSGWPVGDVWLGKAFDLGDNSRLKEGKQI